MTKGGGAGYRRARNRRCLIVSTTLLDETVDTLAREYGSRLADITIYRLSLGIFFTAVKLSTGSGGIVYTPAAEIHSDPMRPPLSKEPQQRFAGRPVTDILYGNQKTALAETVRLVVVNALSGPLLGQEHYPVVGNCDVLDLIDLSAARRIAMVGAIVPFIRRMEAIPGVELQVVDNKSATFADDIKRYCVPAEQTEEMLSRCRIALITGAAIANGTIDHLLAWTSPDALTIVVGPTASFVPDALFARGVALSSGIIVTDPDLAVDMVSEGALAYHLFHLCTAKVNSINPGLSGRALLKSTAGR